MSDVSPYQFKLKTLQPGIDFEGYGHKVFSRVVINDAINDMYPYMEVHVNDVGGIIVDGIVSIEGVEFTSTIGSDDPDYDGWIVNEWYGRNNDTNDILLGGNLGGMIGMAFRHKYKAIDVPKTRAWNDTISNIVKDIVSKDFGVTESDRLFITDTVGKKIRYQAGINDENFINTLTHRAYSSTYEYSPFISFFNVYEEFYFCSIHDIFNIAKRVDDVPYTIEGTIDASTDVYKLKKVEQINVMGLSENKNLYKVKVTKFTNGAPEEEFTDIKNHALNNDSQLKLLINKDFKSQYTYFSKNRYGLYNKAKDLEDYKGFRNSLYLENLFNFKITCIVNFHPNIAVGRLLALDVGSTLEFKGEKSKEYSGDWLIINNKIFFDFDGVPYNVVVLGRPGLLPDSNHPFKDSIE